MKLSHVRDVLRKSGTFSQEQIQIITVLFEQQREHTQQIRALAALIGRLSDMMGAHTVLLDKFKGAQDELDRIHKSTHDLVRSEDPDSQV